MHLTLKRLSRNETVRRLDPKTSEQASHTEKVFLHIPWFRRTTFQGPIKSATPQSRASDVIYFHMMFLWKVWEVLRIPWELRRSSIALQPPVLSEKLFLSLSVKCHNIIWDYTSVRITTTTQFCKPRYLLSRQQLFCGQHKIAATVQWPLMQWDEQVSGLATNGINLARGFIFFLPVTTNRLNLQPLLSDNPHSRMPILLTEFSQSGGFLFIPSLIGERLY